MMSSRAGIQNEDWDDDLSLHQHQKVGAAVAVLSPSRVDSSVLHNAAEPEETIAASSLDDYLQKYPSVFDFVLSIPSRDECKHNLLPSDNERKNEEEPCDESVSVVSDITEMTYRAELMKQAFRIEFEKFRQKQHSPVASPKEIATMFARTLSCPDIQANVNSFVNITSAKIKAEKRRSEHLEEVTEEDNSIGDPTIQMRVDELFVEFGVRPSRSYSDGLLDENISRARPSNEQDVVPDHHLDSIIQLKLQLAERKAAYDELSNKYVAMMLQQSGQQKLLAENSSLKRENERLRAQLDQADMTPAAPNLMKSSLSSGSSKSKLFLSLTGKNDATSPLVTLDSTNSFSSMMQSWRNRAA